MEADLSESGMGFSPEIGIRYLLGADAAGYHMVFFHNRTRQQNDPTSAMAVANLPELLLKTLGPEIPWEYGLALVQALANDRGDMWFFCYCNIDSNNDDAFRDCLGIKNM